MKVIWARIERLLELVRLQRRRISEIGEASPSWASIAEHAAELETEAHRLAWESGCTTHLTIAK